MIKLIRPLGVVGVMSIAAFLMANTASAQVLVGPTPCAGGVNVGIHSFGVTPDDAWLFNNNPIGSGAQTVTQDLAAPIPPGTYEITTVSWDGAANPDRTNQAPQPFEQYFLELLDANSNVLATTGTTPDLPDNVIEAEWIGSIGQVSWAGEPATQVRAVHAAIAQVNSFRNSVHATCFTWEPLQGPGTTTTTTTTTTTAPTTTSTPGSTTTTVPTTPDPSTTTTTVPTEVLPTVEESQPADPVQTNPTFTG